MAKTFRILSRNIRDSFKSVFRNFSLSLASISCISITLIVVAIAMILSANVNAETKRIEGNVTIVVLLDKDITEARFKAIGNEIKQIDNISTKKDGIVAKDKKTTKEEIMKLTNVYDSILEKCDKRDCSPLKDSYTVKVEDISKISSTAATLEKIDGVSQVIYGENVVNRVVTVFDVVRKAAYLAVIALIIVTAFLISNTIKITIFSRRREIDIMRLVGASNMNIKIPFIFEGLILGVLGSIIPVCIVVYGYTALYKSFNGKLMGNFMILEKANPFVFKVSFVLLVIGMVVGMFGSWSAVRKHLKI